MRRNVVIVAGLVCASATVTAAQAQSAERASTPQPPSRPAPRSSSNAADEDNEEIVVAGQRPRGSVIGDTEPEVTLNGGDIRALGVSSINDLLSELGPQLTSARGGQPVVLLEGRRISSFREIATLPAEAIQRAEILPEEVALNYGYPADQKVLNIVLRQRFRAVTIEPRDRLSTDGGGNQAQATLGFVTIRRDNRLNVTADYQHTDMLTEEQRGITDSAGGNTQRSLQPSDEQLTLSATYAHNFSQKVSGSLNGEIVTDRSFGLSGVSTVPGMDVFTRTADDLSAHLGGTLNADVGKWHATLTGTYDHDSSRTISVRGTPVDLARSTSDTAQADLTVNGNLLRLPAGQVSLTTHLGGTVDSLNSHTMRGVVGQGADLDRTTGLGSVNINVPVIKSPSPLIGKLSVNGHVEQRWQSDFGGLTNYGYGFNWVPRPAFRLIGSFSRTETAPSMQQLGGPVIVTPLVPVFDLITGQSVLVTRITGGNPDLDNAEQRAWSLGLTLKPFASKDLTFTVGYNHSNTRNGVMSLSSPTAQTQAAFPGQFVRDEDGDLVLVDARSVNIARQTTSTLRWGFNFSKALKTPQSQLDAMRAAFERRRAEREAAGEIPPRPNGDEDGGRRRAGDGSGQPGDGPGGPGGFGGGGGGGGGGRGGGFGGGGGGGGGGGRGGGFGGGRLTLALYHTWHLEETVQLQSGLPEIDLLDGGSIGGRSGQPRHEVELQAGFSRSGVGLRLTGKWQSSSRVIDATGSPEGDLHFGDLATLNLRTFVTPGQLPGMIGKHPWMRGLRLTLAVNNIFNTRQRVTDGTGATPTAYQPAYLDPLGRTITLSVRKLLF